MNEKESSPDLSNIDKKIVIMSGKGGVGKSTIAANLGVTLARRADGNVGLIDADIHGPDVPKILGVEEQMLSGEEESIQPGGIDNLRVVSMAFTLPDRDSPVIWRGPMKMKALKQFVEDVEWGELDYLLIDLPPGTGDEPLSMSKLLGDLDGAIVVTTPQEVALLDSRKAVNFARKLEIPVMGIVENMSGFVCPHCGEKTNIFKEGGGKKAAEELGVPFLGSVPMEESIVEASDSGNPFVEENPDSKATDSFYKIVDESMNFLGTDDQD